MTILLDFLERHRARHLFRSSHLKRKTGRRLTRVPLAHFPSSVHEYRIFPLVFNELKSESTVSCPKVDCNDNKIRRLRKMR